MDLAIPTNPSTTEKQTLPFEGYGLHDIIGGLFDEMCTGKPSFFPFFKPLQKLENNVSEAL